MAGFEVTTHGRFCTDPRGQMQLYNIRRVPHDQIEVSLRNMVEGPLVVLVVNLADYPILKTIRGGEPVEVIGTIEYVQTNTMIHLKDAKLKFLS
jgi:hypothetical protein